jgi:cytochrome c peroxidase
MSRQGGVGSSLDPGHAGADDPGTGSAMRGQTCSQRAPAGAVLRRWAAACTAASIGAVLAVPQHAHGQSAAPAGMPGPEPIVPIPLDTRLDPKRVALGERLFSDQRLSADRQRSCASCHPFDNGGVDGKPRAFTADGKPRLRNTPTIFNVGFNFILNWDGGASSLEDHAGKLLASPVMNASWPELLARLRDDAEYPASFRAAYADGLTQANVLNALATFERSLATPNARFDRHLRGDAAALNAEEQRGYALFKAYGCVACHQGINVGGNLFQKFGVFASPGPPAEAEPDLGRYRLTGAERDRGVFRVPSLRNVALTAPYFHDGRAPTLEVAVDTMARVQLGRELAPPDLQAIVRFLGTLSGEFRGQPLAAQAGAR